MKKSNFRYCLFLFIAVLILFYFPRNRETENTINKFINNSDKCEGKEGPELEKWYFEQWHNPYGAVLPKSVLDRIWNDIRNIPSESKQEKTSVNLWKCVGPNGMIDKDHLSTLYTGRILDLSKGFGGLFYPTIAAASGGLWRIRSTGYYPLSDAVNSLAVSSFAEADSNTIYIGTGEPWLRTGTGMWKTTNAGVNWIKMNLNPEPFGFFKVRLSRTGDTIYAASSNGFFRSVNSGLTWELTLEGVISDFVNRSSQTNQIYAVRWAGTNGNCLYYSNDGGGLWVSLSAAGLPASDVGRTSISIYGGLTPDPDTLYILMSKYSDNTLKGIYKSTNDGGSFNNMGGSIQDSTLPDIFWGYGNYCNVISAYPQSDHKGMILVGGVFMYKTTNDGNTWYRIGYSDYELHADQHSILWIGGPFVYCGNDGGLFISNDFGETWNTEKNIFPITQYYSIDVGFNNSSAICGGSQDNGISVTADNSGWYQMQSGDILSVSVDKFDANKMLASRGLAPGNLLFDRIKTSNMFNDITSIESNMAPYRSWIGNNIRFSKPLNSPGNIYTCAGKYVYRSVNNGNSWDTLNNPGFSDTVSNITVSVSSSGNSIVYACLNSYQADHKLKVFEPQSGSWSERSAELPNQKVRVVCPHINPEHENEAFALMNGMTTPQKVFRTTNRGINWINITGNLPNHPVSFLIPHPTNNNILYLGTEFGCYKTTNMGTNWIRWNNGMPEATIVTEMSYIDSVSIGRFYIVAGTYGRSVWIREIGGDDPIIIKEPGNKISGKYVLYQNYPNPFNPTTKISFDIPKHGFVSLIIYDILGREISTLVNEELKQGKHDVLWNAENFASGVYFYKIKSGGFVETKRMLLIK